MITSAIYNNSNLIGKIWNFLFVFEILYFVIVKIINKKISINLSYMTFFILFYNYKTNNQTLKNHKKAL